MIAVGVSSIDGKLARPDGDLGHPDPRTVAHWSAVGARSDRVGSCVLIIMM